jgi:hypothetical protein
MFINLFVAMTSVDKKIQIIAIEHRQGGIAWYSVGRYHDTELNAAIVAGGVPNLEAL